MSGWIIGMLLSMLVIANLFRSHTYQLVSLFLGFVIISIPFIIKEEKIYKHINIKNILSLALGIALVLSVSIFSNSLIDLNTSNKLLLYFYIFVAGAIAISAMVLPGISGSTFLLIFGLYVIIITAVKNIIKFNFAQIDIVVVFGCGVLIGILLFTKLVRYLLNNHRQLIVFFIIGLMFGSIYAIIMGPTSITDEVSKQSLNMASLNFNNFSIIWFIVGIAIIIGLEKLKSFVKK
jgi:putative membrane protein